MARKPGLAELSIVAGCDVVLPEPLLNKGYSGEWHAKSLTDIHRALAGELTPVGEFSDSVCHNWSRVYGNSTVFGETLPLCSVDSLNPQRGENYLLLIESSENLNMWLTGCIEMLRNRDIAWVTLYSEGGKVRQWNRTSIRRRLFS